MIYLLRDDSGGIKVSSQDHGLEILATREGEGDEVARIFFKCLSEVLEKGIVTESDLPSYFEEVIILTPENARNWAADIYGNAGNMRLYCDEKDSREVIRILNSCYE